MLPSGPLAGRGPRRPSLSLLGKRKRVSSLLQEEQEDSEAKTFFQVKRILLEDAAFPAGQFNLPHKQSRRYSEHWDTDPDPSNRLKPESTHSRVHHSYGYLPAADVSPIKKVKIFRSKCRRCSGCSSDSRCESPTMQSILVRTTGNHRDSATSPNPNPMAADAADTVRPWPHHSPPPSLSPTSDRSATSHVLVEGVPSDPGIPRQRPPQNDGQHQAGQETQQFHAGWEEGCAHTDVASKSCAGEIMGSLIATAVGSVGAGGVSSSSGTFLMPPAAREASVGESAASLDASPASEPRDAVTAPTSSDAPVPSAPCSTSRPKKVMPHVMGRQAKRMKKCGSCTGCLTPDCLSCQSCTFNSQFGDQLKLGRAECLGRICQNPSPLSYLDQEKSKRKGSMLSLLQEQDDSSCPFKVVDGELRDFRCFICKKLPRAGTANRSELYRHYALYHFKEKLTEEFGLSAHCPICNIEFGAKGNTKNRWDHLGLVHNQVDKYLPQEARIPLRVARGKLEPTTFPAIPAGFNHETCQVAARNQQVILVDGFEIEIDAIPDDPVICSPFAGRGASDPSRLEANDERSGITAPVTMDAADIDDDEDSDCCAGVVCALCRREFVSRMPAATHIHAQHAIQGGDPNLRADANNLVSAGLIQLKFGPREQQFLNPAQIASSRDLNINLEKPLILADDHDYTSYMESEPGDGLKVLIDYVSVKSLPSHLPGHEKSTSEVPFSDVPAAGVGKSSKLSLTAGEKKGFSKPSQTDENDQADKSPMTAEDNNMCKLTLTDEDDKLDKMPLAGEDGQLGKLTLIEEDKKVEELTPTAEDDELGKPTLTADDVQKSKLALSAEDAQFGELTLSTEDAQFGELTLSTEDAHLGKLALTAKHD